ncbi:MAG: 50S ribosomal protein L28 [Candidatus Doudnabacteria bacterium]|nr:50S ribosomal protein L28 [Candidatus Doudnabacteria bacterium]
MISPNKICKICDKGYSRGFARSHSMQATIRRLQPNLQWLTVRPGKRVRACTKCIKSVSSGKVKIPQVV